VKRRVFLILLLLLLPFCALADSGLSETQSGAASQERAGAETAFSWQTLTGTDGSEERERLIGSLDLSSWQAAADEAGGTPAFGREAPGMRARAQTGGKYHPLR